MNLADAIREATGRVQEPPPAGALVIEANGALRSLLGQPGQQLMAGDDGMPAFVTPPAPAGSDGTAPEGESATPTEIDAEASAPQPVAVIETPMVTAVTTAVAIGKART